MRHNIQKVSHATIEVAREIGRAQVLMLQLVPLGAQGRIVCT